MSAKEVKKKASSSTKSSRKSTAGEATLQSLARKISAISALSPRDKIDRILSDPEAEKIVRNIDMQDMYWLIKDVGENDSLEVLQLCTPQQTVFFLDMECWERDEFDTGKFMEWLGYLLEGGEKRILGLLPCLDIEFLTLSLMKTINVGGGIGEFTTKEELDFDWDHTFDNCYFISYRKTDYSHQIGKLIDIIFRNDHALYLGLMESLRHEIPGEVEELNYQLRSGRLGDLGFPAYEDAISIYTYIDPETYKRSEKKKYTPGSTTTPAILPVLFPGESFLKLVLRTAGTGSLLWEFNSLINNAIVAESAVPLDGEAHQTVLERVHGYLNIALEFMCGNNENEARVILETEPLKRLFQLGRSLIIPLRKAAVQLLANGDDYGYAANKALLGLKANHPKFYRAIDPDMTDGYREFREINDIKKMEFFLRGLPVRHEK